MACPPNLVADRWSFVVGSSKNYANKDTRNVLLKCGIHLEHADQRLGDVIEYEEMYVRHSPRSSSVTVSIAWKK